MKKIKLIIAALSAVILICSFSVCSFASGPVLYADKITAVPGGSVSIPINIRDCDGIMGFKLTAEYDSSVFSSPQVLSGSATKSGMLDSSINSATDGSFDIVWAAAKNFSGKGTLFVLTFNVSGDAEGSSEIKFTCSADDTFNEKYEDVMIECSPVTVTFGNEAVTALPAEAEADSADIVVAVESALDDYGAASVDDVPAGKQNDFIRSVNDRLTGISGGDAGYTSVDDIKTDYTKSAEEKYISDVLNTVDGDNIRESIDFALNYYGYDSVDAVPEEKKQDFVLKTEEKLSSYNPELENISGKVSDEEAFNTIVNLQKQNEEMNSDTEKSVPYKLLIIIAVVAVILIIAAAVILKKRKNKNSEEECLKDENS